MSSSVVLPNTVSVLVLSPVQCICPSPNIKIGRKCTLQGVNGRIHPRKYNAIYAISVLESSVNVMGNTCMLACETERNCAVFITQDVPMEDKQLSTKIHCFYFSWEKVFVFSWGFMTSAWLFSLVR